MQNSLKTLEEITNMLYVENKIAESQVSLQEYQAKFDVFLNKSICVPPRFAMAQEKDIPQEMRDGLNQEVKGYYLWGSCGTGKTHILYAVAKLLRANKMKEHIKVTNITDLFSEARKTFDDDSYDTLEQIIYTPDLLLIDDLGVEKQTDWTLEVTYRLINHRYNEMKPTFFASNFSLQELARKTDDRIVSRIAGMCNILKLTGSDKRIKE